MKITNEIADQIYQILVDSCEAYNDGYARYQFVAWAVQGHLRNGNQYRFGGMFGMAGKVWLKERENEIYVTGLNHSELADMSPVRAEKMENAVKTANELLKELVALHTA